MNVDVGPSSWPNADRHGQGCLCLAGGAAREMYRRALATWAMDQLVGPKPVVWNPPDPFADFRHRDWRQLYAGSILDD